MIREALWWADDHRVAVAGGALVLAAAIAALIVVATGSGSNESTARTPAIESALSDEELAPREPEDGLGGSPAAETREEEPLTDAATKDREGSGAGESAVEIGRAAPLSGCEDLAGGAVVDVTASAKACDDAARIADTYRGGPDEPVQTIAGFNCTYTEGSLAASCVRARDASVVTVHFGPGGAGLTECGPVPIGDEPIPVPMRASIECEKATPLAFNYDGGRSAGGFACSEKEQVGVAVIECSRGGDVVAFAVTG
jgi:hypothetical protein